MQDVEAALYYILRRKIEPGRTVWPGRKRKNETEHTELLGDEGDELENKMRKAVLSLGETGFDESEHLSKENKMFDRAPALDSEGESNETAKQHANLWVEEI